MEKGRTVVNRIWIIFVIILCAGLGVLFFVYQFLATKTPPLVPELTQAPSPTQEVTPAKMIRFGNQQFAYSFFTVQNPSALSLIPNFSQPKDAETIMLENGCSGAINGGFYDKSNKPLGYFLSEGKIIGREIDSALVNGFFWADASGSAVISNDLPNITLRFALQTGPMLMFNGEELTLSMNADSPARRMMVAKTMNNAFVFLSVYNGDSVFDGPLLGDLPGIIQAVSAQEDLAIAEAINLDGGSASAFYNGETTFSEITPIGSLFCFK